MQVEFMGRLNTFGLDELQSAFKNIGKIPDGTKTDMLDKMAKVAKDKVKSTGESMGVRDPNSSVHILDNITTTKPKLTADGGTADITFSGTRPNGKKRLRNAEIAFINEYGSRTIQARPFIGTAMTKNEKQIADAGADVLGDWIEKEFQK